MNKKDLSPNLPKNPNTSKNKAHRLRDFATVTAFAAASTFGLQSCDKGKNGNIDPKQETTGVVTEKPQFYGTDIYERSITENLKGIIICENPETKQVFLSDGTKKLTKEFDDIREIGLFDGTLHYVGVNAGKPAIINEKGDTIFSGLDKIEDIAILNGDIAVSGMKNGKTCLVYNNKVIDEGRDYGILSTDYAKNGIYMTATDYPADKKHVIFFVNGEKVGPDFSYNFLGDGCYDGSYGISDYEEGYLIILSRDIDATTRSTLIYNGKTIGKNLENVKRIHKDSELISYTKNGRNYLLFSNGKEYVIDRCPDFEDENLVIFVNDGKKPYYILDGKLHEYEGELGSYIDNIGKTADGKLYFIGHNEKGETLFLDGKKIGTLEHITGAGTTKDGTVFLRGWENTYSGERGLTIGRKNVISINGTVREDLDSSNDSQDNLLHFSEE